MEENYKDAIKKIEPEMEKSVSFLREEFAKIRTSRISAVLIEGIKVDYFGEKLSLKQLATISTAGPRQLIVQPWDASYLALIEKAVRQSGISGSPKMEKGAVLVSFPPLSEDYRKDILKQAGDLAEAVRRTIRKWREKAWEEIQNKTRGGAIREDDKYRAKDELQKLVDKYNKEIKNELDRKEKEIME